NAPSKPSKISFGRYFKADSFVHRTHAWLKITCMLALAVAAVFAKDLRIMGALYALVLAVILASKVPLKEFTAGIKRSWAFILFAFMIPVFATGKFGFSQSGILTGAVSAARILLLMLGAALLIKTTKPQEIAGGLAGFMSPFRLIGFSGKRAASIMSSALVSIPALWEKSESYIKERGLKSKNLKAIMASAAMLLVTLYIGV